MISLKAVLVNARRLRGQLQPLTKMVLIRRCTPLRPGLVTDATTAPEHTLGAIARRWRAFDVEIKTHEQILNQLTGDLVPDLVAAFGIGADIAAEMLIVAGDNPEHIRPSRRLPSSAVLPRSRPPPA